MPVNLGNPDEITIIEFAEEILALTNTNQNKYKPLPKDDPLKRQPDISLAKILNWTPKVNRRGHEKGIGVF